MLNDATGPNLYEDVEIDYRLEDVTAPQVMDILAGRSSDELPKVIESDADDNIYVFMAGHGGHQGVFLLVNDATYEISETDNIISPTLFLDTLEAMHDEDPEKDRYRRILVAVEACHSGVLGEQFAERDIPDVVLFTAATGVENSLAANYSADLGIWTADQFSYSLLEALREGTDVSVADLYSRVYSRVSGSHASVFNAAGFGNVHDTRMHEFVEPSSGSLVGVEPSSGSQR